mgnify:CR=1 FL=1
MSERDELLEWMDVWQTDEPIPNELRDKIERRVLHSQRRWRIATAVEVAIGTIGLLVIGLVAWHATTLVEAGMVGRCHGVNTLRPHELARGFQGVGQRRTKLRRAGLAPLRRLGNRARQQQAGIVDVRSEGRWFGAVHLFVGADVLDRDSLGRDAVRHFRQHEHEARR